MQSRGSPHDPGFITMNFGSKDSKELSTDSSLPLYHVGFICTRAVDAIMRSSFIFPFPCAGSASYPFVDLPPGIILRCKLFPSDKFAEIRLYFFYEIAYNGAGDKSEFGGENMTAHMRLR